MKWPNKPFSDWLLFIALCYWYFNCLNNKMLYYIIDWFITSFLIGWNKIFYIKKSCDLRGVYIIWYHQSCRSMKFRLSYCVRRWLKPDVINKRSKYDRIPLNLICFYQFVMESCNKTTINCWGGGGFNQYDVCCSYFEVHVHFTEPGRRGKRGNHLG